MKRHLGILHKILLMIAITGIVIGGVIITAGATMIYKSTENGIETEISMAAQTLTNMYHALYDGNLSYDGEVCHVGEREFTEEDFSLITDCIGCEEDVDFTLFYGDTRIFTSVRNADETLAVGTKAAFDVVESVLIGGSEYISSRVLVNERYYMGCYLPIESESGEVIGMLFAGKPLESAEKNAVNAVLRFLVLAVVTLVVSALMCMLYIRRVVADIDNIKSYLGNLAEGDFSTSLDDRTISRTDEIGELAQYSIRLRENLRDMVERDPLTTLLNRRTCHKILEQLRGTGYAVVMGDIDFFKRINDTYGHAAGDYVLKEVASMLKECTVPNGGHAVRWGGEEFLLVFPQLDVEKVYPLISRLLSRIRSAGLEFNGSVIPVTMTFGIAYSSDWSKPEKAINEADSLLYHGKENGRNQIVTSQTVEE